MARCYAPLRLMSQCVGAQQFCTPFTNHGVCRMPPNSRKCDSICKRVCPCQALVYGSLASIPWSSLSQVHADGGVQTLDVQIFGCSVEERDGLNAGADAALLQAVASCKRLSHLVASPLSPHLPAVHCHPPSGRPTIWASLHVPAMLRLCHIITLWPYCGRTACWLLRCDNTLVPPRP